MIKQITEKSIGLRVRWHLFYSPERWMYFEVDKITENIKSLAEFTEKIKKETLPKGVYQIETFRENKIFMILYNETVATDEAVLKFAHSLGL